MPDLSVEQQAFIAAVNEITWSGVGKALATGVASGIGGWCVTFLLNRFLASEGTASFEPLIHAFREELEGQLHELRVFIQGEFENARFLEAKNLCDGIARNLETESELGAYDSLWACWRTANLALGKALDVDSDHTRTDNKHIKGFALFFTILCMKVAIIKALDKLPPDPSGTSDRATWHAQWSRNFFDALDEGRGYIASTRDVMHGIFDTGVRCTLRTHVFNPNVPTPTTSRWSVEYFMGDEEEPYRHLWSETEIRETEAVLRLQEVGRLDSETQRKMLSPAEEIVRRLGMLRLSGLIDPGGTGRID